MSPKPLLLGHRGARATRTIPENTFPSFDLALAHGCDGFEFDVRRTAEGRAVICHDAHVNGIEVASAPAQSLSELPQLDSVVARYGNRAFLDIELKVSGLEDPLTKLLNANPLHRGCVVSSFLPEVLVALSRIDGAIPLGLICEDRAQLERWKSLAVAIVISHYRLVDENLVQELHEVGKQVFVWTVNEREMMLRFGQWGVDGMISDDTQLLASTLGSPGQGTTTQA